MDSQLAHCLAFSVALVIISLWLYIKYPKPTQDVEIGTIWRLKSHKHMEECSVVVVSVGKHWVETKPYLPLMYYPGTTVREKSDFIKDFDLKVGDL